MRQVVERIKCDLCGNSQYSDGPPETSFDEVEFGWQGRLYALDVCIGCRAKVLTRTLGDLLDAGVELTRDQKVETPKRQKTKRKHDSATSAERWKGCLSVVDNLYHCPDHQCDRTFTAARALGGHVGQQHPRLKALAS